jgi:hypothetical protein
VFLSSAVYTSIKEQQKTLQRSVSILKVVRIEEIWLTMSQHQKAALEAFFQEVEEQLGIKLNYLPDNDKFPIQLENAPVGLPRNKCVELLQFIKGQVDLRENEIAQLYASKTPGKFLLDISSEATKGLVDVYGLSMFYPDGDEDDENTG